MSNVISISNTPKALSETLFREGHGLRLQPEAKVNFGSVYTECIRKQYLYMKSCKRVFKQNESDRGIISYILHGNCINCNPQEYHIYTRIFMGRRCCFRTPFQRNSNLTQKIGLGCKGNISSIKKTTMKNAQYYIHIIYLHFKLKIM